MGVETEYSIVGTVKEGVEAANEAFDLYKKFVSTIIPWDIFTNTIKELNNAKNQYSVEAASFVGEITTLILDSIDQYDSASLEVYRWCKSSSPLLEEYINLFASIKDPAVAEAQKLLMNTILEEGEKKLGNALHILQQSKSSFNGASGKLQTLLTILDNDFKEGSSYYNQAVDELRAKAYGGAASGAFFGPIGVAISYSIASGVVEGKLIPDLKKAFAEVEKKFNDLEKTVSQAIVDIVDTKGKIDAKISSVNKILADIEETKNFVKIWVKIPAKMFEPLKKSVNQLIQSCKEYIKAEDDKKILAKVNAQPVRKIVNF